MRQILDDAADLFLPLAEDKDIDLETSLTSAPLIVLGDRTKIQRVIANLLDNAIKFTPPGGKVMVSVRADDLKAIITIEDTGPGISADDLPHIFERFYRCDKSRSTPGNGLGLSLALALIHVHSGRYHRDKLCRQREYFYRFYALCTTHLLTPGANPFCRTLILSLNSPVFGLDSTINFLYHGLHG